MKNQKPVNVRLPIELYSQLEEKANSKNISMSALIRMVLTEWNDHQKKK